MNPKKLFRYTIRTAVILLLLPNIVAAFHAYKFTHNDPTIRVKTKNPDQIGFAEKVKTFILGVNNPRPLNVSVPEHTFETLYLKSNKQLECWKINADASKGTVILFHGYGGQKYSLLERATVFLDFGYSVLLVDFMGSGGSEGNQTTIGFYEAIEVKDAFEYVRGKGEKNILLFGTSMGAAAIMKAQRDYALPASAILIECPFGSMLETVQARFKVMKLPAFPMANFLVFWGGLENNFNAFAHNPAEYAKEITCPTLLLYGEKDIDVSRKEIDEIFKNLKGKKELRTYPLAGHENYLKKYRTEWTRDVAGFLATLSAFSP